jgi:hypothetical protein
MNKAVAQICALCWLFLLRLIMHGTNIKMFSSCLESIEFSRFSNKLKTWLTRNRGSLLGRHKIFFSFPTLQIGCGTYPTPYFLVAGALLPELNRPGRETSHWGEPSAKVKNKWRSNSVRLYTFMAWRVTKYRNSCS